MGNTIQSQLQAAQMSILREVDKICRKNNITYWLAFGTCIGAVRHGGFIPWDDDIDLFMKIEDLEKLETLQSEFPDNIFIQSRRTDPEFGLMISRVRDSNTTLIEKDEDWRNINHGIFVDIYPLYNCPSDKKSQKKMYIDSLLARLLLYGKVPQSHGAFMKIGSKVVLSVISKKNRTIRVEKIYNKMKEQKETGLLTYAYGHTARFVFNKDEFYPVEYVKFEDMFAPIPKNFDKLLTHIYGDYMKLPPKEKQVVHHEYKKVDCNVPYLQFKGIEYCVGDHNK